MKKREQKARVREIWNKVISDLAPGDDARRSIRIRALCPCALHWDVPLWDIIFDACEDKSPLVRQEALHVIEDAESQGIDVGRGKAIFRAALKDEDPTVRCFVEHVLRNRRKERQRSPRRAQISHAGAWKNVSWKQQTRLGAFEPDM